MIQLAALPTTATPASSALANAPASPAGQAGESADQLATAPNSADFASLLAAPQTGGAGASVANESAALDTTPVEAALIGARAMLQQLAAALQQGGKSLPVAGKLLAVTAADGAHETVDKAETRDSTVAAATDPASPALPDAAALPLPAFPPAPVTNAPETPATPDEHAQSASHRSDAAQAGMPSLSHAALPALVEAQLHGRPLTIAAVPGQPDQVTVAANDAASAETRTITVARNAATPVQAFTLNSGTAPEQPGAVRLRPIVGAKAAMAKSASTDPTPSLTDPASAGSALAVPQGIAPSTPGAPVASPIAAGHDFAKLVDRLIEARDAASPQGIHVAMDHAEFGKVSLSFHQDAAGLSVSVASPDPDFARAVQAATPSASADGMGGQTQSDARQGAQPDLRQQFSGTSAQSHSGGQGRSFGRETEDGRIATNPSAASAAAGPEATRRRGLFA